MYQLEYLDLEENNTYEEIIKDSNSDIVMFMYNSSGFDSMVKAMIDKGIK